MQKPNVPPKLAHLIIILSSVFSPFSPLFKTTAPFNKSLTLPLLSPSHHPFTHPFKLPPPLIHTLPLCINTLSIPPPPFLSHHTLTTYSTLHPSFPPRFTSSFSPILSPHPCQTKAQRDPKTRTTHKSINPPLHFYRFTFLRFYTFTENSQRKIHPTHCSVNTALQKSDFLSIRFPC